MRALKQETFFDLLLAESFVITLCAYFDSTAETYFQIPEAYLLSYWNSNVLSRAYKLRYLQGFFMHPVYKQALWLVDQNNERQILEIDFLKNESKTWSRLFC